MATLDTRNKSPSEKLAELTEVGMYLVAEGTFGDTTLDAAAAAGQKVVPVTSDTDFTVADAVVIDHVDVNQQEIGIIDTIQAGVSLTMRSNLAFAHASADACKELQKIILGEATADGVQDGGTIAMNVHNVGTRHGAWDSTPGHHEQLVEFDVVNFTLDNLKRAFGLADAAGSGAGSLADPWILDLNPENFVKGLLQSALAQSGRIPAVYMLGEYLNTGEIFEKQYMSCSFADGDRGFQVAVGADPAMAHFRFNQFSIARALRYQPS